MQMHSREDEWTETGWQKQKRSITPLTILTLSQSEEENK